MTRRIYHFQSNLSLKQQQQQVNYECENVSPASPRGKLPACTLGLSYYNSQFSNLNIFNPQVDMDSRSKLLLGTSLVVQWLRLPAFTVGGAGSIPDGGSEILHATSWHSQKKVTK